MNVQFTTKCQACCMTLETTARSLHQHLSLSWQRRSQHFQSLTDSLQNLDLRNLLEVYLTVLFTNNISHQSIDIFHITVKLLVVIFHRESKFQIFNSYNNNNFSSSWSSSGHKQQPTLHLMFSSYCLHEYSNFLHRLALRLE